MSNDRRARRSGIYRNPLLASFLMKAGIAPALSSSHLLQEVLTAFARIPYENLSKIAFFAEQGSRHIQTPEEVLQGYWSRGTGGTCFPLTNTLYHLIDALGFDCHLILADRRYGHDTHCAIVLKLNDDTWCIVDPGFMINIPCPIPSAEVAYFRCGLTDIALHPHPSGERVELFSAVARGPMKYRLTYKLAPVERYTFERAWGASFDWEMMNYPILSGTRENTHAYVQKGTLYLRSSDSSKRLELSPEELAHEISQRFGIDNGIINRAFERLRSNTN